MVSTMAPFSILAAIGLRITGTIHNHDIVFTTFFQLSFVDIATVFFMRAINCVVFQLIVFMYCSKHLLSCLTEQNLPFAIYVH